MISDIKKLYAHAKYVAKREVLPAFRRMGNAIGEITVPDRHRISGPEYHAAFAALEKEDAIYESKTYRGAATRVWAAPASNERVYVQTRGKAKTCVDGKKIRALSKEEFGKFYSPFNLKGHDFLLPPAAPQIKTQIAASYPPYLPGTPEDILHRMGPPKYFM